LGNEQNGAFIQENDGCEVDRRKVPKERATERMSAINVEVIRYHDKALGEPSREA
jgi:hypothetical protein